MANHIITDCFKLAKLGCGDQVAFMNAKSFCFMCLKPGHRAKDCKKPSKCRKCSQAHPTISHMFSVALQRSRTTGTGSSDRGSKSKEASDSRDSVQTTEAPIRL